MSLINKEVSRVRCRHPEQIRLRKYPVELTSRDHRLLTHHHHHRHKHTPRTEKYDDQGQVILTVAKDANVQVIGILLFLHFVHCFDVLFDQLFRTLVDVG